MASNDMNSWDEDPDERLRQRWQQTFADFEVPARPLLSRRILNTTAAGQQHKRAFRMANLLLLLLLAGGLLYPIQLGEKPERPGRHAAKRLRASPVQPYSRSRDALSTVPIRRPKPLGRSVIDSPDGSVTGWQPLAYLPTAPRIDVSGGKALANRSSPQQLPGKPTDPTGFGRRMVVKSGPSPRSSSRLLAKLGRSSRNNAPVKTSAPVAHGDYEQLSAPERQLIGVANLPPLPDSSPSDQPLSNAFPTDIARLKPREMSSLSHELHIHPGQLPAVGLEPQVSSASVVVSHRHWFAEVVPLSYFQWMSTSPASAAYLSRVNTPAAFSPATWGYQINGGIRFRHWQAYLLTGQLRRWAYYTINKNQYRVEPGPTDPHQVVRETQGVVENVALPMLGAGLSQQTLLARGRYTVDIGGQASYLPTSNQTLMSLRGGTGRRLLLSRRTELQAGLTVEYGLNQLLSEQQHLVIHPLVVGIRLRIQPRPTR